MWLRSAKCAVVLQTTVMVAGSWRGAGSISPRLSHGVNLGGRLCVLLWPCHGRRLPGRAARVPHAASFWQLPPGGAATKGPVAAQAPWAVSVRTHVPHRGQSEGVSQGTQP